jgi:hypothetical protein
MSASGAGWSGRWAGALAWTVTALALLAIQSCTIARPSELEAGRFAESVAAQKHINRYFHDVVMPRLTPCWNRVEATGRVELKYVYERDAMRRWTFKQVEAGRTDLPPAPNAAALACMRLAVAGTSFPSEPREVGESYALVWTWPVPLPPDVERQYARMLGNSGGEGTGCDGHGAPAACVTCSLVATCLTVCVGRPPPCTIQEFPGGTRTCTAGGECASGGLLGVVGGVIVH